MINIIFNCGAPVGIGDNRVGALVFPDTGADIRRDGDIEHRGFGSHPIGNLSLIVGDGVGVQKNDGAGAAPGTLYPSGNYTYLALISALQARPLVATSLGHLLVTH